MNIWLIILIILVALIADHASGVILGPFWKKWIMKLMGVPKIAMEFVALFLKVVMPDAEGKIRITDTEWKDLQAKLNELYEAVKAPEVFSGEAPDPGQKE